ncbi:MAG: LuxR C-terminal-related transcriptional regulator [Candidatus Kapaibacterium sp.]
MKQDIKSLNAKLHKEANPKKRVYFALTLAEKVSTSDIRQSVDLSLGAIKDAQKAKDKELIAVSFALTGRRLRERGDHTDSIRYCENAIRQFKKIGDDDALLDAQLELATALDASGNSRKAFVLFHEIILARTDKERPTSRSRRSWEDRSLQRIPTPEEAKKNLQIILSVVFNEIAISYFKIGEKELALDSMLEGLKISERLKDTPKLALSLANVAGIYLSLERRDLASRYMSRALRINRQRHDQRAMASNLYNMAFLAFDAKKMKQGRQYAQQAFMLSTKIGEIAQASKTLTMAAENERKYGSLNKAEALIKKSLDCVKEKPDEKPFLEASLEKLLIGFTQTSSRSVYEAIIQLYERATSKKFELQYEIAKELVTISQELKIYQDTVQWQRKVREYELKGVDVKQNLEIAKIMAAYELEQFAFEKEVLKMKTRQLQSELKAKIRETELLARQLAKKGSFLASLNQYLFSLKKQSGEYSKETIEKVIKYVDSVRHKDKEFERLEEHANGLHHDFLLALSKRYTGLTETERKICLLFRLGLRTNDVSNVLFASVRTVETHCLSIRKKLKIPKGTRIAAFIRAMKG